MDPGESVFHPAGCAACEKTGYKGRLGVHEVVDVDEPFSRLIMAQAPGSQLRAAAAAAGMVPIRDDAVAKVRAGLTSTEDVVRQVYTRMAEE
jgi:type IV pilus assembly protein PilB